MSREVWVIQVVSSNAPTAATPQEKIVSLQSAGKQRKENEKNEMEWSVR